MVGRRGWEVEIEKDRKKKGGRRRGEEVFTKLTSLSSSALMI
jgi:hypothetical protein